MHHTRCATLPGLADDRQRIVVGFPCVHDYRKADADGQHMAAEIGKATASIGADLFSGHRLSVEDLLKHAEVAMYQA